MIYGTKINFVSTCTMAYFNTWHLPLITSITGILFYYELMSFFAEKFGERKLINFISRNTYVIMETHLLFTNIPNIFIYWRIQNGSRMYNDFRTDIFRYSAWYRHNDITTLIGLFLGIIGSLTIAYILEKIKNLIHNLKNKELTEKT